VGKTGLEGVGEGPYEIEINESRITRSHLMQRYQLSSRERATNPALALRGYYCGDRRGFWLDGL
jgi:hypothetical protein